jgi:hypothetical protein
VARDSRGPVTSRDQAILREIQILKDRITRLENNRALTSPIVDPDDVDDPIEGEHIIDHTDHAHKWYEDGAWRSAHPVAWAFGKGTSTSIPSGTSNWTEIPLDHSTHGYPIVSGESYGAGPLEDIFGWSPQVPPRFMIKPGNPGLYMIIGFVAWEAGVYSHDFRFSYDNYFPQIPNYFMGNGVYGRLSAGQGGAAGALTQELSTAHILNVLAIGEQDPIFWQNFTVRVYGMQNSGSAKLAQEAQVSFIKLA